MTNNVGTEQYSIDCMNASNKTKTENLLQAAFIFAVLYQYEPPYSTFNQPARRSLLIMEVSLSQCLTQKAQPVIIWLVVI